MPKSITTRIKHISHTDLDGVCCSTLSELIVNSYPQGMFSLELVNINPKLLYGAIKQTLNEIGNYDLIIITDLAISPIIADLIQNSGYSEKFRVMDHHESDCDVSKYPWLNINKYKVNRNELTPEEYKSGEFIHPKNIEDTNAMIPMTCGTELYYKFIKNDRIFDIKMLNLPDTNAIEHLVETVASYDTFTFDIHSGEDNYLSLVDEDAPRLNTLYHAIPHEEFRQYIDDYIHSREIEWMQLTVSSHKYPWVSKIVELEERSNQKYVEAALKKLQITKMHREFFKGGSIHSFDYTIGLVFAEKDGPLIGKAVRDQNIPCDICAVVANNQISFYRVNPDIDVSIIARLLNGGGHKGASGFTISYESANAISLAHFNKMVDEAANIGKEE